MSIVFGPPPHFTKEQWKEILQRSFEVQQEEGVVNRSLYSHLHISEEALEMIRNWGLDSKVSPEQSEEGKLDI